MSLIFPENGHWDMTNADCKINVKGVDNFILSSILSFQIWFLFNYITICSLVLFLCQRLTGIQIICKSNTQYHSLQTSKGWRECILLNHVLNFVKLITLHEVKWFVLHAHLILLVLHFSCVYLVKITLFTAWSFVIRDSFFYS